MVIENQNRVQPSPKKRMALWAITPNGLRLGRQICASFKDATLFAGQKTQIPPKGSAAPFPEQDRAGNVIGFESLTLEIRNRFNSFESHVFIFSAGIAVRMIAPLVQSKLTDPAVVVIDDRGQHVISLLSGHLGGANQLARALAPLTGGRAIITTATDVNRLPSIDLIAKKKNLFIETPENIKQVNMAFLRQEKIRLEDPLHLIRDELPLEPILPEESIHGTAAAAVACTWEKIEVSRETLILRPRVLAVGMGCNRNTPFEVLHDFFFQTLDAEGLSVNSVCSLASTEVKADEKGLIQLSHHLGIPILFYDNPRLNSVKTIQNPSQMVEKHIGVKSVCEAAAILAAQNGSLMVPKRKNKDVTMAVAIKP